MLADLFEPFQLGDLTLANRMVIAPMMRNRADENGIVDLVAFGILFLANPDLVRRYRENLPLNAADPSAFYGGGVTLGARLAGEVIS